MKLYNIYLLLFHDVIIFKGGLDVTKKKTEVWPIMPKWRFEKNIRYMLFKMEKGESNVSLDFFNLYKI